MGSTITQRYTEALRTADHDIGVEFTGWCQQSQAEQIGGNRNQPLLFMDFCYQLGIVVNFSRGAGI